MFEQFTVVISSIYLGIICRNYMPSVCSVIHLREKSNSPWFEVSSVAISAIKTLVTIVTLVRAGGILISACDGRDFFPSFHPRSNVRLRLTRNFTIRAWSEMLRKRAVESRTIKSEAFSPWRSPGVGEWIGVPWGISRVHVYLHTSAIGKRIRQRPHAGNSRGSTALSFVEETSRIGRVTATASKEEAKTRFHQETLELIFVVD